MRSAIEYLPVDRKIERWFRPDEGESGSSRLRALGDQTPLIVDSESVPCGLSEIPRMVGGPALSLFLYNRLGHAWGVKSERMSLIYKCNKVSMINNPCVYATLQNSRRHSVR